MLSRHFIGVAVVATAAYSSLVLTGAGAAQASTAAVWHTAIAAPGVAALNTGANAAGETIACPAAGDCSATGAYYDSFKHEQAFVIGEANGVWGKAIEVPGLGTLNRGGYANISGGLSCSAAGKCTAGGMYKDGRGIAQAFLVQEVNGVWHNAFEVPGFANLNKTGPDADVAAISCRSAGYCSVGGSYETAKGIDEPFVVNEVNGVWHNAIEMPGIASIAGGGAAGVSDLSCTTAGNCEAAGWYGSEASHGYVAREVNGVWHNAVKLPANLPNAAPDRIWCSSAGNCSIQGSYAPSLGSLEIYVESEVNGVWRKAVELPGLAALNTGNYAWAETMSCLSAGNCVLSGQYSDKSDQHAQIFVASEVNGSWHDAVQMPGDADLSSVAALDSGACASLTNCSFGVQDGLLRGETYVIDEVNGVWQHPAEMPGVAALNTGGDSSAEAIACASAGKCGAIGSYANSSGGTEVFVASES